MRRMRWISILGALAAHWLMATSTGFAQIKAFPQAEGFGAIAKGGRGGDVYHVTNLNDSGTGSLRFGIDNAPTSGRTIVFDVGGWITLNSKLGVTKSNITIAGQTAPGGGIGIKGNQMSVGAHDVVLRHLRVRPGKGAGRVDSLSISSGSDVIFDHISAAFSYDENASANALERHGIRNLSVQYSSVAFGLEDHSAGSLIQDSDNLSYHHNLYAHNNTRNPKARVEGMGMEWLGNVVYDYNNGFIAGDSNTTDYFWKVTFDGNSYLTGPGDTGRPMITSGRDFNYGVYFGTNAYDNDGDATHDPTNYTGNGVDSAGLTGVISGSYTWAAAPYGNSGVWLAGSPQANYLRTLEQFGATPWKRDEVDTLLASDVVNRHGSIISHENELVARGISNSGFGTLANGVKPADTDNDGIPNAWEIKHGTNPNVANNNGDFDFDGYTDLEEYLNDLAAFKATGPLEFSGIGRYADWKRWTNRWEPSRVDEVRVGNAAAFVDAVGQKAGTLRVGQGGRLYVTSGWLEVTDDLWVASSDGTSRLEQHGGEIRVGSGVYLGQGKYQLMGGKLTTPMLAGVAESEFEFTGGMLQAGLIALDLVNDGGTLVAEEGDELGNGVTGIVGNLTIHSGAIDVLLSSSPANEIDVSGTATLGGNLNVLLGGGFVPSVGQSWKFLTASSFAGNFDSITAGFTVSQIGNSLWLTAGAGAGGTGIGVPEPDCILLALAAAAALLASNRKRDMAVVVCCMLVGGMASGSAADTLNVVADAELRENSANMDGTGATDAGSGTGTSLNARWNFSNTPPDKNEWIALKFDLSQYSDKTKLVDVALRTTMHRSSTNNTKGLRLYALTPGTAGENWNETTITYGTMPGFTFDMNSTTNVLNVGGAIQSLGLYSVSGVESEGNVASINPASLTTLVQNMGNNDLLTLLISFGASSNGQWRISSREATQTETGVQTGGVGDFAAYLQFDVDEPVIPTVQGDYNDDGVVNAADYTVWRDRLGNTTLTNEEVSPNTVDIADYLYWRERFGASTPGGSGALAVAAVPEPAAWALVLLGALAGIISRVR